MGNPITKIRKEVKAASEQAKQEMEQRMQILEKMVDSRLQSERTHIINGERGDQEIHAGTIVSMHKQINIKESEKESQDFDSAIDDFFSGNWMGGLKRIIHIAAEAVLGNEHMGEYESTDMFIIWNSNALLRCDAYYYRWNFVSSGVIDQTEGVVGVLLVKRVIDVTKVDPQVLTWAISEQASRQGLSTDETSEMIDSAMKVLDKVVQFQAKVRQIEAGVGEVDKPSE